MAEAPRVSDRRHGQPIGVYVPGSISFLTHFPLYLHQGLTAHDLENRHFALIQFGIARPVAHIVLGCTRVERDTLDNAAQDLVGEGR